MVVHVAGLIEGFALYLVIAVPFAVFLGRVIAFGMGSNDEG